MTVSPTSTAIIVPSSERGLATALTGLEGQLRNAAQRNIDAATEGQGYTQLEKQAMVTIEALRLTNGIDLAAVLLRGSFIRQIRELNLARVHPGNYATLEAMAVDQNISVSELSDTIVLCDVIFPYIEDSLDLRISDVWDQIGKSGFRELAPVLKALITGTVPPHGSVAAAVTQALENAAAGLAISDPDGFHSPADIASQAVADIVELGRTVPVREIRRHLRPNGTADISTIFIRNGEEGDIYSVMRMNQEQYNMVNRLIGTHLNPTIREASDEEVSQYAPGLRRMLPGD